MFSDQRVNHILPPVARRCHCRRRGVVMDFGYRLYPSYAGWDGVFYGRSRPKTSKAEGDSLEGWRANLVGSFVSTFQAPMVFVQGEDFQRLGVRIHQPGVGYAMGGVNGQLVHAIHLSGGGREYLADPVRCQFEIG